MGKPSVAAYVSFQMLVKGHGISVEIQCGNPAGLPQLPAFAAARADLTVRQLYLHNFCLRKGWQGARCKKLPGTKEGCAY